MASDKTKLIFNPLSGNFDAVQDVADLVENTGTSSDNAIPRFVGTDGDQIENTLAFVQDDGRVTAGADGTSSLDLVTKQQLDAAIQGVDVKEGVKAASTADLTLSGEQTVDGVALVTNDRILVKNQAAPAENGVYIVAVGAWTRSTDTNTASELNGAFVSVNLGTANANTGWYQYEEIVTLGTDPVNFNKFFGAGTYAADGQGIELSGSTFSLELDGSTLSKSVSGVKVASQGITNTEVSNSAAIAYSKLSLANSIVNNDINTSAAIAYSKLNLATSIVNADIATAAAIAYSKLAALTASRALVSDGSGVVSVATTTSTEIGYVNGVTSSIQTQLNTKFAYNLSSVSTNTNATAGTTYLVDSSAGIISVTLPAPAANAYVIVKDALGASPSFNITVLPNGAENIDGAASYVISSAYESKTFVSDGTNWFIL